MANIHYQKNNNEEAQFQMAFKRRLPIMLTGPTGCGKTRFIEYMGEQLQQPVITISCHDDLTSSDLVGRFMVRGGDVIWNDGPLTRAVKQGAICYLDEVVEARKDTTVVLHPLSDYRRQLPLERLGITLDAAPGFCLVVSYNPGYQSVLKDLKDSTRQRMVAINFDYPSLEVEQDIVAQEAGITQEQANQLVTLGQAIRRLETAGLREVASTRVLIAAGLLVAEGLTLQEAAETAIAAPLSDDDHVTQGLMKMIDVYLAA